MEVDKQEPEVSTTIVSFISLISGILKVPKSHGRARGAKGRSAAGQRKGKGSSVGCRAKGSVQSKLCAPAEQTSGRSSFKSNVTIAVYHHPGILSIGLGLTSNGSVSGASIMVTNAFSNQLACVKYTPPGSLSVA